MADTDETLTENSTESLLDIWYSANLFGIHFGWFILATALLVLYFWPQLQRKLDKSYQEKQTKEYDAKCKKNPDWFSSRQNAMEAARIRMQEELSKKAKEHEQKMKEREEKKKQERLAQIGNDTGGHTLGSDKKKSKSSFKPEYHPLMGSGPSTTYRPPKRSCCPSGGCG